MCVSIGGCCPQPEVEGEGAMVLLSTAAEEAIPTAVDSIIEETVCGDEQNGGDGYRQSVVYIPSGIEDCPGAGQTGRESEGTTIGDAKLGERSAERSSRGPVANTPGSGSQSTLSHHRPPWTRTFLIMLDNDSHLTFVVDHDELYGMSRDSLRELGAMMVGHHDVSVWCSVVREAHKVTLRYVHGHAVVLTYTGIA